MLTRVNCRNNIKTVSSIQYKQSNNKTMRTLNNNRITATTNTTKTFIWNTKRRYS